MLQCAQEEQLSPLSLSHREREVVVIELRDLAVVACLGYLPWVQAIHGSGEQWI